MLPTKKLGLLALIISAGLIWILPTASLGRSLDLKAAGEAQRQATQRLLDNVKQTVIRTEAALRQTKAVAPQADGAQKRAIATDPKTQPPLHGANPHGQGGVAVVDIDPKADRPLTSEPDGSVSGEDVIVGRARGEQVTAGGASHGHITIAALFGKEIAGVDTTEGQTKSGPLDGVQTGLLDPLCNSTNKQVCLSVLTADSTTTATGSTNDFAAARASLIGVNVGAAESRGEVAKDANCQSSTGSAKTANVATSGGSVAQVANSASASKSCRNQAPQVANSSQVIGLGGVQVPLPAAGCANGTPDTVTGLPPLLPIVCNADEIAGAAAVREALDVFAIQVGGSSLVKETTAAAESLSVAPAGAETSGPACSDKVDNDGDGKVDAADPGCHSDGNANNPNSYNPNDTDEADPARGPGTSGSQGDTECSDKADNDGDGKVDARDPGCHSDGDAGNSGSYDPADDDESDDGGSGTAGTGAGDDGDDAAASGAQPLDDGSLPFTGTDVIGVALAGLLLLAGGLLMRRREGLRTGL